MSLPEKLASIGAKEDTPSIGVGSPGNGGKGGPGGVVAGVTGGGGGGGGGGEPPDPNDGLMQRIIVIRRDEKGYGFTVSGDNPVFVASVKNDGAASKAGLQRDDKIIKVNGTLVTNRNHLDVVKLIKSGSYVALTLRGKRSSQGSIGGLSPLGLSTGGIPSSGTPPNITSTKEPGQGRVTAPLPVDPDKDRELQQQRINMTRSMYETAKEDFEKLQQQYVDCPNEKLHTQLLEKERTKKALENQLRILTGEEAVTPTKKSRPGSNRFSDSEHSGPGSSVQSWQGQQQQPSASQHTNLRHVKQGSVPSLLYRSRDSDTAAASSSSVARSKSDAASRRSKTASTFYVGLQAGGDPVSETKKSYFQLKRWRSLTIRGSDVRPAVMVRRVRKLRDEEMGAMASSLPTGTSDMSSMSDSPLTSPSVSPTPNDAVYRPNGQEMMDSMTGSTGQDIITIDDEDIHSEEDQANDPGPFADIKMLDSQPAHMSTLLNYLISNSDPAPVLFHIISDIYSRNSGSTKELRKWAYEIFSTFIPHMAPLRIVIEDNIISQLDTILTSANRTDNETVLRNMFSLARQAIHSDIAELLADFRNKRDLGMANLYGYQKVQDNMDKASQIKVSEELLIPHLEAVSEDNNRSVRDRDQAIGWSLATFLRQVGGSKSAHSSTLDRVQTFMMKDKRSIKFPGSRSSRAKGVKGHQFNLQHFYTTTFCNLCSNLIWGVGYQGYQCQSCEMTLHKQCVEEITETCGGKQKKRVSKLIPVMPSARRYSSNSSNSSQSALSQLYQQNIGGKAFTDMTDMVSSTTQPLPKEEDVDLALLGVSALSVAAGLPSGHGVKDIISRYTELASPTGTGLEVPGAKEADQTGAASNKKGASDLNRSGSLNNKGEKSDRPARRAKSDVDVDSDMFKAINQSGSSSASSLSNRSMESPSQSTEGVNTSPDAALRQVLEEADCEYDIDCEPRTLQELLGDDVLRKLKPKEKKRQEVINELFYTERNHLRNLLVLDRLFNRPMLQERGTKVIFELALALFPNMEEMISLHESLVKDIKVKTNNMPVKEVGDILLKRFDGEAGEKFRKGCAEYCRNQAFALEALKKHTKKEPKLAQFLIDAELNPQCRRLQLKDLVPSQMQRLTKYPLLIDNLMKHTQSNSEEYKHLEQAHEKCKHILAYVNQAVKECENYHKLRDIQRKLDTKSLDPTDGAAMEIKKLDLLQHKLIFDSPLTWKLRSHRILDLHLLLFETMLVLLQRQDDKYVLKFIDEHKGSYSPVLQLKNIIVRNLATDKKVFFVVNMADVGAQMYEFTAATSELRIKWCKLIEDRADELKRQGGHHGVPATRSMSMNQPPTTEKVELERSKTTRISRKSRSVRNQAATNSPSVSPPPEQPDLCKDDNADQVDSRLSTIADNDDAEDDGAHSPGVIVAGVVSTSSGTDAELIQPDEVRVDSAVVMEPAQPVRSPLDLLRKNHEVLMCALDEQERLIVEYYSQTPHTWRPGTQRSWSNTDSEQNEEDGKTGRRRVKVRRKSSGAASEDSEARDEEDDYRDVEAEGERLFEETPDALVVKALRLHSCRQMLLVDPEANLLSSLQGQTLPGYYPHQQPVMDVDEEESLKSPTSPKRPLSILSQGSSTETEPTTPTSPTTMQRPQQKSGANSQPKEQLMKMQAEMDTIFVKLMGAMNSGREERSRLREELAEVQQMLAALKEQQRQMTEAGVVPPDRPPQLGSSGSAKLVEVSRADIPSSSDISSKTTEQGDTVAASTSSPSISSPPPPSSSPQIPAVPSSSTSSSSSSSTTIISAAEQTCDPIQTECTEESSESMDGVHHGLQEATITQLEESVEALTDASSSAQVTGVIEVAMTDAGDVNVDDDDDDDDDDDNNEVSVKDLPLPDMNIPVVEDNENSTSMSSSRLLDGVELQDSDSDDEGTWELASGLVPTVEDISGEEHEEQEDEAERELVRKLSDTSLLGVDSGNNNKHDDSSSVDDDSTPPIQI